MEFNKGFRLDENPLNQPANSWRWAKNMLLNKEFKSISNEPGFSLEVKFIDGAPALSPNYYQNPIIGVISTGIEAVYFIKGDGSNNVTKRDAIVVLKDGRITTIIRDDILKFNVDNPIEGVFKYSVKGELIVSWWDGVSSTANSPKLLNLTNLPFPVNANFSLVNPSDYQLANLFIDNSQFDICPKPATPLTFSGERLSVSIGGGGSLATGVYQFAIGYEIENDVSNYTLFSNSVPIADIELVDGTYRITSNPILPTITSQSINLILNKINTNYNYLRLVVIKTINGIQNVEEVGRFPITSNILNITYIGQKTDTQIALGDVIVPTSRYIAVKTGTVVEDRLHLGNVRTRTDIKFQPYANNIKVALVPYGYLFEQHADSVKAFKDAGGRPGEVYALYIHLVFKDGSVTEGFHIPGRVANAGEKDLLSGLLTGFPSATQASFYEKQIDTNVKRFQTRDTSSSINGNVLVNTSYWENENEKYPNIDDFTIKDAAGNITGTIQGDNVRHHKIPEVPFSTDSDYRALVYHFAIDNTSIVLPNSIANDVVGYILSFARKELKDISVLGEGYMLNQKWFLPLTMSPPPTSPAPLNPRDAYKGIRFHDYALVHSKPTISPSYIKAIIPTTSPPVSDPIDTVTGYTYFPRDNGQTVPSNIRKEQCLFLEVSGNHLTQTANTGGVASVSVSMGNLLLHNNIGAIRPILGRLVSYKKDVHLNFNKQNLALTHFRQSTVFVTPSGNKLYHIFSGDAYIGSDYAIIRNDFDMLDDTGIDPAVSYPGYGIDETDVNRYIKINPRVTSLYNLGFKQDTIDGGEIYTHIYNKQFNKLNTENAYLEAYDWTTPKVSILPYRIPRSIVNASESVKIGWRTFLAHEYYEMPKDKGEIWKLGRLDKTLIINMKRATYVARVKDALTLDAGKVYTGVGDIFDRQPDELVPINGGYAGCQSQFAAFACKYGYVFPDIEQGKVFLYDGKLKELNEGLSNYLFDNRVDINNPDNPFWGSGATAGFDEEYNRLLFSIFIGGKVFTTLSYSFDINTWVSGHDYYPLYLYNDRSGLHSIHFDGTTYTHNKGANGSYYLNGQPTPNIYKSYIDIVFNSQAEVTKLLNHIEWIADVKSKVTKGKVFGHTFTHMAVYNDRQLSKIVDIRSNPNWFTHNARNAEETWRADNFLDDSFGNNFPVVNEQDGFLANPIQKSWFNRNFFIGKFVVVRFIYDNVDGDTINLHNANAEFIPSYR